MCDDLHYLWHLRLAYVNFGKVSFMSKHELIHLCEQKSEIAKRACLIRS